MSTDMMQGRGVNETVTGATGGAGESVGKGIQSATDGVEDGAAKTGKGVKDAGEWK